MKCHCLFYKFYWGLPYSCKTTINLFFRCAFLNSSLLFKIQYLIETLKNSDIIVYSEVWFWKEGEREEAPCLTFSPMKLVSSLGSTLTDQWLRAQGPCASNWTYFTYDEREEKKTFLKQLNVTESSLVSRPFKGLLLVYFLLEQTASLSQF